MPTLDTTRRDQVTVEAETVEAALVEISSELGEDAEIMRAQKVHRGGVGGFFAKEMVQLTARRRRGQSAPLRPKQKGSGIAGVLERMAQDADAGDGDFRSALRRELASAPSDTETEGFLAAVGWEEDSAGNLEDHTPPAIVSSEPAADAVTPAVDDEGAAEIAPEPIAVGPVLQTVPPLDEPVTFGVEPASEPTPTAGEVIPVAFPVEPEFDEAAAIEIERVAPEPVAEPVAEAIPDDVVSSRLDGVDAPEGMGAVDWGTTSLLRLGSRSDCR